MSIAISNSLATATASPATPSNSSNTAAAPKLQPATNDQADLFQLTTAEQAQQLYSQGHTVPQIASTLNLSAQAVDTYLNISNATTK
jgi:DNA-binding NarL/FixJ family response regulator